MMKVLYLYVSKLFEKTKRRKEILLLRFGNLLKKTTITPNTLLTSFKRRKFRIDRKVKEFHGVVIVIINGSPFAIDKKLYEELLNENRTSKQKNSET